MSLVTSSGTKMRGGLNGGLLPPRQEKDQRVLGAHVPGQAIPPRPPPPPPANLREPSALFAKVAGRRIRSKFAPTVGQPTERLGDGIRMVPKVLPVLFHDPDTTCQAVSGS